MNSFFAATLSAEFIKIRKSKTLITSVILFAFIGTMVGLLMYAAKHPEIAGKSAVLGTKASLISKPDWLSFFNLTVQMVLSVGSLGSGFVAVWVFGREYSDRIMKELLCLPVPRHYFATAKFIIIFTWSIFLMVVMLLFSFATAGLVGLDNLEWNAAKNFLKLYSVSGLLTLFLTPVAALITCMSRNLLMPIVYLILTMIITQFTFVAIPPITPYLPWAIPALASGIAGNSLPGAGPLSYIILFLTAAGGIAGTSAWLRYADQK